MEEKNTEFHFEGTPDGRTSKVAGTFSQDDKIAGSTTNGLTLEQLHTGLAWTLQCIATTLSELTEAERYSLMRPDCDLVAWNLAEHEYLSLLKMMSSIVMVINKKIDKLGGTQISFAMQLFSPITGRSEDKMFIGTPDIDVTSEMDQMPKNRDESIRRLHEVQQEAANFLIDYHTGKGKAEGGEAFIRKFAADYEIDVTDVEFLCDDNDGADT